MNDFSSTDDRIQRAIEGLLSPEEFAAFKTDVIRDPALREAYVEQLWLHSTLRAERDTLIDLLDSDPAPISAAEIIPSTERPAFFRSAPFWAAAAASVTLAIGAFFFHKASGPAPVATLVQAANCKWAGSDLPTAEQSKLGPGTLALVEGIATIEFKNGARVTIEAPTTLEILSAMRCRLVEGSVVAEVPEPAHGFTIDTAEMKLVDLGTKFGLTAGATGSSHVIVFDGEVRIDGLQQGKSKHLTTGNRLQVGRGGGADQEPSRGKPWAELAQEDGGWTSISTAFGSGKDTYVRRMPDYESTGSRPVIMVKHSDLADSWRNERRGYITFDLKGVPVGSVKEAQLILDPEPSGYGFSTMVPDSRFAIYGITDESLDRWDEVEMDWASAPAANDEGPLQGSARRLAEFWIPRGGSGSPLTIRSDALAEFLREDTNGLASFIIIRETGENDSSGLVHAFASREHPTARPPTLRIK